MDHGKVMGVDAQNNSGIRSPMHDLLRPEFLHISAVERMGIWLTNLSPDSTYYHIDCPIDALNSPEPRFRVTVPGTCNPP